MELLEPFQYPFMVNAFAIGGLIAAVCAALSCFIVLRGWSLMGDAISHAVLPGIVLANALGIPVVICAFLSGLLCAVGSGWIKTNSRVKEDTAMGVMFTGLFAFGLVMFSMMPPPDVDLHHVLFGNILRLRKTDIVQCSIIATTVLVLAILMRRDFMLVSFDRTHARAIGLRVRGLNYLLLVLLSLVIVAAMQATGVILVTGALIAPGATAFLLTKRFDRMLLLAVTISVGSTWCGIYASFFAEASPAGCIILAQAMVFGVALLFAPRTGMLRRRTAVL